MKILENTCFFTGKEVTENWNLKSDWGLNPLDKCSGVKSTISASEM